MEPQYAEAAISIKSTGYSLKVLLANMDGSADQSVLEQFGAKGFPTIVLFKDKDPARFELYGGERTSAAILEYIHAEYKTLKARLNKAGGRKPPQPPQPPGGGVKGKAPQKAGGSGGSSPAKAPAPAPGDAPASLKAELASNNVIATMAEFLAPLGLQHYETLFRDEEIDIPALRLFGAADFKEIGLKLGARVKIMEALKALGNGVAGKDEL